MFNPEILRWGWLVVALTFFLAEVFTAGFVLAAFGVGALAAALVAFLGLGIDWQLVLFVLVSVVAIAYSRRFAERITGPQAEGVGVDRVLGKRAVVLEIIDPIAASGRVRVDREEWRAQSANDEIFPVNAIVEIVRVEGTRLIVRRGE
ncbi:MAG: NfeD family protein [Chloroflexi bacterium]|nr:NfeD family protein [Chloroflexota bacterium]